MQRITSSHDDDDTYMYANIHVTLHLGLDLTLGFNVKKKQKIKKAKSFTNPVLIRSAFCTYHYTLIWQHQQNYNAIISNQ